MTAPTTASCTSARTVAVTTARDCPSPAHAPTPTATAASATSAAASDHSWSADIEGLSPVAPRAP
jgi:hypothetical protein